MIIEMDSNYTYANEIQLEASTVYDVVDIMNTKKFDYDNGYISLQNLSESTNAVFETVKTFYAHLKRIVSEFFSKLIQKFRIYTLQIDKLVTKYKDVSTMNAYGTIKLYYGTNDLFNLSYNNKHNFIDFDKDSLDMISIMIQSFSTGSGVSHTTLEDMDSLKMRTYIMSPTTTLFSVFGQKLPGDRTFNNFNKSNNTDHKIDVVLNANIINGAYAYLEAFSDMVTNCNKIRDKFIVDIDTAKDKITDAEFMDIRIRKLNILMNVMMEYMSARSSALITTAYEAKVLLEYVRVQNEKNSKGGAK
jgi:hypothetical protein